ncbi:MAG TPA: phosphodiester glycosidase family protein [Verrucomicrobiae bacterium]
MSGIEPIIPWLLAALHLHPGGQHGLPPALANLKGAPIGVCQVQLTWDDFSDYELLFFAERTTNGFASSTLFVLPSNSTNFVDTNVLPGVAYRYRLRACNLAGCSANIETGPILTGSFSAWTPLFQGIEHATGTTALGVSPQQVVNMLRVDLRAPGVHVFTTPPSSFYLPDFIETFAKTTSHFLEETHAQAAINGQWFAPCCTAFDGLPEDIWGMAISSNRTVSLQESETFATALIIGSNNVPMMIGTNWPPISNDGIWQGVSGKNPLLYLGEYVGTNVTVAPRTAIGYSEDGRYLFLITIDGRQPGYSDGATDCDTAAWLASAGAYNALMLDGGGSTTMAIANGAGGAALLNQPIRWHPWK